MVERRRYGWSFSSESEFSQPESHGGSGAAVSAAVGWADIEVLVEVPALWDAAAETNEELTLGGWGSGVNVVKRVSHPSGLRLRSRSPSPLTSFGRARRGAGRSECRGPPRGEARYGAVLVFDERFDQAAEGTISM